MDFIKRNKILGAAVILLVVANVILLTFIWIGKDGPIPGRLLKGGGQFLDEQLKLTIDQESIIKDLRDNHFKTIEDLRKQSNQSRRALHNLIKKGNSQLEANDLANKIGALQSKIEYATYRHFYEIREVLNEDQKEIFDQTIINVLAGDKGPDGPKGDRPPPGEGPLGRRPPPQRGGK